MARFEKYFEGNRTMNLDDVKKQKITEWIGQGLKLSEIQTKLASELDTPLTYMEVRLLVDELKLVPKDQPARVTTDEAPTT